jgi:nucleotide-binding universal stress UspA family protein
MLHADVIAIPVSLQRYADIPPVAVRQRDLAEALAVASGARLVVFSCEANLGLVAQAETVRQKLDAFTAPLVARGLVVESAVLAGAPAESLPSAIVAAGADLAVVGSHAKRSTLDVAIGSTASALMKSLACPVLLVRPTTDDVRRTQEMIIPHYPPLFAYF